MKRLKNGKERRRIAFEFEFEIFVFSFSDLPYWHCQLRSETTMKRCHLNSSHLVES